MELLQNYKPTTGRHTRYHWSDMADGQWRLAKQGEDYDSLNTFQSALHHWARRSGHKVKSQQAGSGQVAFIIYV